MKSGALNRIQGSGSIDDSKFPQTHGEKGHTLRSSLKLNRGQTTFSDVIVHEGLAMREQLVDGLSRRINTSGDLEEKSHDRDKMVDVTRISLINDDILITESTKDNSAREIISTASGCRVSQVEIDILSFIEDHPEAVLNMAGSDQGADVSYFGAFGDIQSAKDIPEKVQQHPNIQLGFEDLRWNGKVLRGVLTKSGYVAIFAPKDISTEGYCQFVVDRITPYMAD